MSKPNGFATTGDTTTTTAATNATDHTTASSTTACGLDCMPCPRLPTSDILCANDLAEAERARSDCEPHRPSAAEAHGANFTGTPASGHATDVAQGNPKAYSLLFGVPKPKLL